MRAVKYYLRLTANRGGAYTSRMEIISSAAKPVRFSVSMAEELKNSVDRECSRRGVSLSILLEKAVRAYLKKPAGK